MEVFAGEKATRIYGLDVWLPDETLQAVRDYVVSIKGPLTTPVGGGIRSLNVALRQELDLYACLRPVQYFSRAPSPLKEPEKTNMVIFRENSEDIYAGIEFPPNPTRPRSSSRFAERTAPPRSVSLTPRHCVKPVSARRHERLIRSHPVRYRPPTSPT